MQAAAQEKAACGCSLSLSLSLSPSPSLSEVGQCIATDQLLQDHDHHESLLLSGQGRRGLGMGWGPMPGSSVRGQLWAPEERCQLPRVRPEKGEGQKGPLKAAQGPALPRLAEPAHGATLGAALAGSPPIVTERAQGAGIQGRCRQPGRCCSSPSSWQSFWGATSLESGLPLQVTSPQVGEVHVPGGAAALHGAADLARSLEPGRRPCGHVAMWPCHAGDSD